MPIEPKKDVPIEIKSIIDTALGAFNNKNFPAFNGTFGGEVVIIDGFAPFRWTGSNSQGRWWADAERWAKDLNVLGENIAVEKVVHWQIVGVHAYVVLSATLAITLQQGEPIVRSGILTYTFAKAGEEWKVESQAWGRLT